MAKIVKILVFSDIHHHLQNYSTNKLRNRLLSYLSERFSGKIDYIVIAGDLFDKGKADFDQLEEYLRKLSEVIGIDIANLFVISGNHDLERTEIRENLLKGFMSNINPVEAINEIQPSTINFLKTNFSSLESFCKRLWPDKKLMDPLHKIHVTENLRFIFFNTCLFSGQNNEEGKLCIGQKFIVEDLKDVDDKKINIAFGHHSIDCLLPEERKLFLNNLDQHTIDAYFCGHAHKPEFTINLKGRIIPTITCGSMVTDSWSKNSFIYSEVNTDSKKLKIQYYTFNKEDEFWYDDCGILEEIGPNNSFNLRQELFNNEEEFLDDMTEFRNFIISFSESLKSQRKNFSSSYAHKDVPDKFEKMKCNETTKKEFNKASQSFPIIDDIINSTSILDFNAKEVIPSIIIDIYREVFSVTFDGQMILTKMLDTLEKRYRTFNGCSYSTLRTFYKKTIYWSINECDIFNETVISL